MLQTLRASSKNIVVKFILILIALTFVFWGIGDMLRSGSGSSVKVGNYSVSKNQVDFAVRNQVNNFQRQIGSTLSEQQIKQFGFARTAFETLAEDKLLLTRADDIELQLANDVVQNKLSSEADFKDDDGRFDEEKFQSMLRSNNISQSAYVENIKNEERKDLLTSFIEYEPTNFKTAAQISYNFKNESRKADLLYISKDAIDAPQEPTAEEKQAYYDENKDNYKSPETRKVTYLKYGIDDVKSSIVITQEDIEREYNNNIDYFTEPEKRSFEQYLIADEKTALEIFDKLNNDKLSEIKDSPITLDDVTEDSLPEKVSEVVFGGEVGKFNKPVKSDLGWHVVKLTKITESKPKPINTVRSEIRRSVREDKANDLFYESISAIEDEFASGKTIAQIAEQFNIRVQKIESITNQGLDKEQKEIKGLPDKKVFLPLVFEANLNETSSLAILPDNENYVVVEVDNIEAEKQKELAEVESEIITAWKNKIQNEKLTEFVKKTLEDVKEKDDFSAFSQYVASDKDDAENKDSDDNSDDKENKDDKDSEEKQAFELKKDVEFVRAGNQNQTVPQSLKEELYSIDENSFTAEHQTNDGKYVIAQLKSISGAKESSEEISDIEKSLKAKFANDLDQQYKAFLKKKYPVSDKKIAKLTK